MEGWSACLGIKVVLGRNQRKANSTRRRCFERPEQDTTNMGCVKATRTAKRVQKCFLNEQIRPICNRLALLEGQTRKGGQHREEHWTSHELWERQRFKEVKMFPAPQK